MKMEVLAVQQQYQTQYGGLGSNKIRDWTSTFTLPLSETISSATTATTKQNSSTETTTAKAKATATTSPLTMTVKTSAAVAAALNANNSISNSIISNGANSNSIGSSSSGSSSSSSSSSATTPYHHPSHMYHHHHHHHRQTATSNKMKNSIINKKTNRQAAAAVESANMRNSSMTTTNNSNNFIYCDNDIDAAAVDELSLRLLNELRAAKSRHLTCTEVSLPCDLTPSIAAEIIRVSEKEPCGIRGCTIYIEFEDEPNNSRRIASMKLDPETVSTFEVYLTLRQDHRGWTALLPQFMKNLARTITISPEFTITKHKLYSPQQRSSSSSYTATTATAAISTPSS